MDSSKNGCITFYFDTLPDLQAQLWAALGPMALLTTDTAAKGLCPQPVQADAARTLPAGTVYYTDGREPTQIPATQATPFELTKAQVDAAGEIAKETVDAIRTASGIDAAVRQANKEAAVVLTANAEALVEAVEPPPAKAETVATPTPEQNTPAITLETLANAPYPELLAFCERNPGVGVDVFKCQQAFFRKLVEMKIKTFLETK